MIRRAVVLLILIILLLVPFSPPVLASEAGTSAAPFLLIDVGARPAALGGAYTGLAEGPETVNWNPAGLGFIQRSALTGLHLEFLAGDNYEYLAYARPIGSRSGIGVSTIFIYSTDTVRTATDDLNSFTNYDAALSLSYGRLLMDRLAAGITGKIIESRLAGYSAEAYAFDAGLLYRTPIDNLTVGGTVKDVGTDLTFIREGDPLPRTYHLGLSYRFAAPRLLFTAESVSTEEASSRYGLGLEWRILDAMTLRGGYRINFDGRNASGFTGGLGFRYSDLSFDYAYVPFGAVGATHRIQSTLLLGGRRGPGPSAGTGGPLWRRWGLGGTSTLGLRYVGIDNRDIVSYPNGLSPTLNISFAGSKEGTDVTGAAAVRYDSWDDLEADRVTFSARRDDFQLDLGDFPVGLTPYTMTPKSLRGAAARYEMDRSSEPIPSPSGESLRGVGGRGVNIGRYLREGGMGYRVLERTEIRGFAGRTEEAVNLNDKIPNQNGDYATYGVYEQYAYGAELVTKPAPLLEIGLRSAHFEDDPNSLHSPGTTDPTSSTVLSLDAHSRRSDGVLSADGEIAYSFYDDNIIDSTRSAEDMAARLTLRRRIEERLTEVTFERIGPDFQTTGNPSTRTLRDRLASRLRHVTPLGDRLRVRLDAEAYRDNLDHTEVYTTETLDGSLRLDWTPRERWGIGGMMRRRTDISGFSSDPNASLLKVSTANNLYQVYFRAPVGSTFSFNSSWTLSEFINRNLYSTDVSTTDFNTTSYNIGLSGSLGGRGNLSLVWARYSTDYIQAGTSSTVDSYSGRIGYRIVPGRLSSHIFARLRRGDGTTQDEVRDEYGGGLRYNLSTERALSADYTRIMRRYTPVEPELDYKGETLDLRLTTLF